VVLEELEIQLKEVKERLWKMEKEFWDLWASNGYYKSIATVLNPRVAVEFTNAMKVAWSKVIDAANIIEKALKMLRGEENVRRHENSKNC